MPALTLIWPCLFLSSPVVGRFETPPAKRSSISTLLTWWRRRTAVQIHRFRSSMPARGMCLQPRYFALVGWLFGCVGCGLGCYGCVCDVVWVSVCGRRESGGWALGASMSSGPPTPHASLLLPHLPTQEGRLRGPSFVCVCLCVCECVCVWGVLRALVVAAAVW